MSKKELEVSFIFPCLNEEETMAVCVKELQDVMDATDIPYEIIISDNGSTDRSVEIAKSLGVRIEHADKRGYGEALKNGFAHARGKYIAFADIDGSYPLQFLPKMYEEILKSDADMVIASRMMGKIEKGAMPPLHRYAGTPVLTTLINLFFCGKLSDCNSGFRIMKKSAYESWGAVSGGMEFASELLIKALKHKAKIIEIPAGLRPDKRTRPPHLKTWRDGMRHLLFILSETPKFFEIVGITLLSTMVLLQVLSMIVGRVNIGGVSIFDYHSKLIFLLCAVLGLQSWIFAISLYLFKPLDRPFKISERLMQLKEETLFFTFVCVLFVIFFSLIGLMIYWASMHFENMQILNPLIDFVYFMILLSMGSFGLLQVHILKRIKK